MKHPWWHWFFTTRRSYPQLIPPSEAGGRLVIVQSIEIRCKVCWQLEILDGLTIWRADQAAKRSADLEKMKVQT